MQKKESVPYSKLKWAKWLCELELSNCKGVGGEYAISEVGWLCHARYPVYLSRILVVEVTLEMIANVAVFWVKSKSREKSWKRGDIWMKCERNMGACTCTVESPASFSFAVWQDGAFFLTYLMSEGCYSVTPVAGRAGEGGMLVSRAWNILGSRTCSSQFMQSPEAGK